MTRLGSHTAAPHVPDGEPFWPFGNWGQVTQLIEQCQEQTAHAVNAIFGCRRALLFLFGARHDVLKRRGELLLEFGVGHRLAGQHLIPHGGVVDEDRFNERGLRQIFRLESLVGIHIRMMRPRIVIERVLHKLEARDAHSVKTQMVRSTGVLQRKCADADVFQGAIHWAKIGPTAAFPCK